MISKDNTADVVADTTDGIGNGLDEPFIPNPGTSQPTITYTIKAANDAVKFVRFAATVTNVQTVKVFVVDTNNNVVAPINPKQVKLAIPFLRYYLY